MLDRRAFLARFLVAPGTAALAAQLIPFSVPGAAAAAPSPAHFPCGVASADPQADAIMLWTRAVNPTDESAPVNITAEIALDADFTQMVGTRQITATDESDHTVRLFVENLSPDTRYFYRFRLGGAISRIGRTRTAPATDSMRPLRYAFTSCQGYEDGFYGPWARMVADDEAAPENKQLDFVIQLGDFIYEKINYLQSDPVVDHALGSNDRNKSLTYKDGSPRRVPPFPSGGIAYKQMHVADTLDDYRHLYKTYLADPDLQAARARFAFISTWDDHEFANDHWQSHGEDGGPDVQAAPNQQRRMDANQAWSEYIPAILTDARVVDGPANPAKDYQRRPVRNTAYAWNGEGAPRPEDEPNNVAAITSLILYRQLRFGKVMDLLMTDCRSFRSRAPLPHEWVKAYPDVAGPLRAVAQLDLADQGREANDGNPPDQFTAGDASAPNPHKDLPMGSCLGQAQKSWFKAALKQSTAQWKVWGNSIPLMPLRLDLERIPFAGFDSSVTMNTDAWDGYPHERAEIMRYVLDENIDNVISLAGDHHLHMAGTVLTSFEEGTRRKDENRARPAMAEFATAGISSSTVFRYIVQSAQGSALEPMTIGQYEDGTPKPIINMTLMQGCLSGLVYANTSSTWLAGLAANSQQNAHFEYVDTDSTGYGLVEMDMEGAKVTLVGFDDPYHDHDGVAPLPSRKISFVQKAGSRECAPPQIEGRRVFGFEHL